MNGFARRCLRIRHSPGKKSRLGSIICQNQYWRSLPDIQPYRERFCRCWRKILVGYSVAPSPGIRKPRFQCSNPGWMARRGFELNWRTTQRYQPCGLKNWLRMPRQPFGLELPAIRRPRLDYCANWLVTQTEAFGLGLQKITSHRVTSWRYCFKRIRAMPTCLRLCWLIPIYLDLYWKIWQPGGRETVRLPGIQMPPANSRKRYWEKVEYPLNFFCLFHAQYLHRPRRLQKNIFHTLTLFQVFSCLPQ